MYSVEHIGIFTQWIIGTSWYTDMPEPPPPFACCSCLHLGWEGGGEGGEEQLLCDVCVCVCVCVLCVCVCVCVCGVCYRSTIT